MTREEREALRCLAVQRGVSSSDLVRMMVMDSYRRELRAGLLPTRETP